MTAGNTSATRRFDDEGASLILVLALIVVLSTTAAGVLQLSQTSRRTARAIDDKERLLNALDVGLAAAVEQTRIAAGRQCATLDLPNVDGLESPAPSPGPPPPALSPLSVKVTCVAGPAENERTFRAIGFLAATPTGPVQRPCLRERVRFDVPSGPTGSPTPTPILTPSPDPPGFGATTGIVEREQILDADDCEPTA